MYAVIQTGGKQYRVRAGDVIVVEKLDGDVGAEISFDTVLMMGGGEKGVSLGSALQGAAVTATLIETRKGEKIKVFKKIRRQGYRRTQGHRQFESVLRITGLEGGGEKAKWDGEVDLTPRSVLVARARGLAPAVKASPAQQAAEVFEAAPAPKAKAAPKAATASAAPEEAAPKKAAVPNAVEAEAPEDETAMMDVPVSEQTAAPEVDAEATAPKKAAKPKAANAEAVATAPAPSEEAAPKKAAAPKKPKAAPKGDAE